jgi:hypothetical protein
MNICKIFKNFMEKSLPNKLINGKEKLIFSILANPYKQKEGFESMGGK